MGSARKNRTAHPGAVSPGAIEEPQAEKKISYFTKYGSRRRKGALIRALFTRELSLYLIAKSTDRLTQNSAIIHGETWVRYSILPGTGGAELLRAESDGRRRDCQVAGSPDI